MSALIALKLLAGVAALLCWVAAAAVRSARDWPYRHNSGCDGERTALSNVPKLFLASAVSGGVAVFLDALQ